MSFSRAFSLIKQSSHQATGCRLLVRSLSDKADIVKFNKDIEIRNVDDSQQSPLVVIVGWSNSKLRQIEKYSQIYEEMGCTVVSASMQLYRFALFFDTLFANDTMNVINAMTTQRNTNLDRKVFFKLFSTPGPIMYINIMNYYFPYIEQHFGTLHEFSMAENESKPNICGVIYDSATVGSGNARQFANGMKGNSVGILSNYFFDVLGKLVYAYAVRTSKMHNYGPEFLRNVPLLLPQLFLSSENDKIASIESIRKFVDYQKDIGVPFLKSKVWENSDHVLHYRKYPDEYRNLVNGFIDDCIQQTNPEENKKKIFSCKKKDIEAAA